jgi:hypothetical protein
MTEVGRNLEVQGAAIFTQSFDDLIETLESKRADLMRHTGAAGSHV